MENKFDQRTRLITEGSIVKSLFVIAWPIVFANTLHTAYQLIDTFWVGRLGAGAVASVSICYPLIFFFMGFGFGLAISGAVFVAQYAGARRYEMVNHISAQTILMMLAASLVFSVAGYLAAPHVLRLIGAGDDIFPDANRYLQISYLGLILSYGFIVFQSLLRGIGEVRFPLYVISFTVVLNAIFDPLFIFGWGPVPAYGVAGAAWATVATQAVAAAVGMGVLFTGRYGIHLRLKDFIPDPVLLRRTVLVGLPASLEQSNRTLGSMILIFLVTAFGTLAIATFGIGMRIMSFIFIPAFGLAMATTTLVGQNIGAGNIPRAEEAARLSSWVAFWFLGSVAILFFIFAPHIVRFFVPEDEALVLAGAEFIHITSLSFGIIGAQQVLLGAFRGAGGTTTAMVFSFITQWLFQLPISWYLCRHTSLGVTGVWWGFPVANIIATLLTIYWFRRGSWKELSLTEKEKTEEERETQHLIEEAVSEQEYID